MRKTLILFGMVLVSFLLVACGGETSNGTPVFNSILIDGSAPVLDGELVTFYREKNEVFIVAVNITNPDQLAITSIKIDGYNYFASRFLDESTTSTIYFEMSAGSTLGEKVLSLDEIEYKSGDVSKTVVVSTNNEFNKYVYKNRPTVERESYSVTKDSIIVNFDISDNDEVITANTLIAELYSGETLIASQTIISGRIEVVFESLLANKSYDVKVKADFDLDDNQGYNTEVVIYSGPFSTFDNSLPSATIINTDITSNSIVFDIEYNDNDNVTVENGISVGVFEGDEETPIATFEWDEISDITISDLLNNTKYTLKVLGDYDLLDGHSTIFDGVVGTHVFRTDKRVLPDPVIENEIIEENRVVFVITFDDPDGTIDKDTLIANLYVKGELKETVAINGYIAEFQVYNLFANDSFVIEIIGSYDLNDGQGVIENEVIYIKEYTTNVNTAPSVNVDDLVITQGYVSLDIGVTDTDSTLSGALTAKLYEIYFVGDVEFEIEVVSFEFDLDETEIVFEYMTSYLRGYRVDITADYDLRDGSAPKADENLFRSILLSTERKAPTGELSDVVVSIDEISAKIIVLDSDETIEGVVQVYLYDEFGNDVAGIDPIDLDVGLLGNEITFSGLLSNREYKIVIKADYTYHLLDGDVLLENHEFSRDTILTLKKEVPVAEIGGAVGYAVSIEFDVEVIDISDTIDGTDIFAVLYQGGVDTGLFKEITTEYTPVTFTGLLSDKQYEIKIIADYDLNDGSGVIIGAELTSNTVNTSSKENIPTSILTNMLAEDTALTFDIVIIDDHIAITGNTMAVLYRFDYVLNEYVATGDELLLDLEEFTTGFTFVDQSFTGLDFGAEYVIKIVTDYNMFAETSTMIVAAEILSQQIFTHTVISINEDTVDEQNKKIIFEFEVDDAFDILSSDVIEVQLYDADDNPVGLSKTLTENSGIVLLDLFSDSNYYVLFSPTYDLGLGENTSVALRYDFHTLELDLPVVTIDNDSISGTISNISFDVSYDAGEDSVVQGLVIAYVYADGDTTTLLQQITITEGTNTYQIFGLDTEHHNYQIVIKGDIDVNDGNGIEELYVFDEATIIIEDNTAPTFNTISDQSISAGVSDIDWTTLMFNETDNRDVTEDLTKTEVTDNVDYITAGTYTVTVRLTDTSGNYTEQEFNVIVN